MRARFLRWLSKWWVPRASYEHLLDYTHDILQAPVGTGTCCCGSPVDRHGYNDGHSPVDEWDHYAENARKHLAALRGDVRG